VDTDGPPFWADTWCRVLELIDFRARGAKSPNGFHHHIMLEISPGPITITGYDAPQGTNGAADILIAESGSPPDGDPAADTGGVIVTKSRITNRIAFRQIAGRNFNNNSNSSPAAYLHRITITDNVFERAYLSGDGIPLTTTDQGNTYPIPNSTFTINRNTYRAPTSDGVFARWRGVSYKASNLAAWRLLGFDVNGQLVN